MTQYDNTDRGALFKNDRKTDDRHPDYNGTINVGGKDYDLGAWLRTSKAGQKYMSLMVSEQRLRGERGESSDPPNVDLDDLDSEIPF